MGEYEDSDVRAEGGEVPPMRVVPRDVESETLLPLTPATAMITIRDARQVKDVLTAATPPSAIKTVDKGGGAVEYVPWSYATAASTGSAASRRSTKCMPLTTRPSLMSKHGMTLT